MKLRRVFFVLSVYFVFFLLSSFGWAQQTTTQSSDRQSTARTRSGVLQRSQERGHESNRFQNKQSTAIPKDNDQEARDSMRRIPWDELEAGDLKKIRTVIRNHTLFRRMPNQSVYCDPEIYQYFLDHPDLVVGFWEQLGVTDVSVKEIEPEHYFMRETSGTVAKVDVVYRSQTLCIVYAKGQYRGPFVARPIDGETVLILRSRFGRDKSGESFVVCRLDAFVKIDNAGVDFLAKLFSMFLGKIADSNFEQTVAFVGHVSDAACSNTDGVKAVGYRVGNVRKEVREDFAEIVDRVSVRYARRLDQDFSSSGPAYAALESSRLKSSQPESLREGSQGPGFDKEQDNEPERIFRGYETLFAEDFAKELDESSSSGLNHATSTGKRSASEIAGMLGAEAAREISGDHLANSHSVNNNRINSLPSRPESQYAIPQQPVANRITFSIEGPDTESYESSQSVDWDWDDVITAHPEEKEPSLSDPSMSLPALPADSDSQKQTPNGNRGAVFGKPRVSRSKNR